LVDEELIIYNYLLRWHLCDSYFLWVMDTS